VSRAWRSGDMHPDRSLYTAELRDTKERLNERMSDDEVTQIQFRAGQEDLQTAQQQLRDVDGKLADRNKEYAALEERAALQVPPPSKRAGLLNLDLFCKPRFPRTR